MTEEKRVIKHWLSQIDLANWYSDAQFYYRPRDDKERNLMHNCYEEGYNKGYDDRNIKWHDLRKNPNDLPEERQDVLCFCDDTGYKYYCTGFIYKTWFSNTKSIVLNVIAWCELPKFEE